jgi:glycerol-3-phosphate acyltransferase PlsY
MNGEGKMPHVKNATRIFFFLFLVVISFSILTAENHHLVTLCFAAYGLGSIPFGYILARYNNHDLKKIGSGSIGATNVLRTGDKGLAALTLLLDVFKGWFAVLWLGSYGDPTYIIALTVVVGHLYPVWLDFKGGKGVATGLGVLLALSWPLALISIFVWLLSTYWFRISSLSALVAWALAPVISIIFINQQIALLTLMLCVLIFIRHMDNIQRLIRGTEPRIGQH